LDNGQKSDPATAHESNFVEFSMKDDSVLWEDNDGTKRISPGKSCASSRGNTGGASVIRNNWA
jgi:hypothetical protein